MINRIEIKWNIKQLPVPRINSNFLHSFYDPVSEGEKLANRFVTENPETKNILVMGLGFAYHIRPLLAGENNVFVYEPEDDLVELYKSIENSKEVLDKLIFVKSAEDIPVAEYGIFVLKSEERIYKKEFTSFFEKPLFQQTRLSCDGTHSEIRILLVTPIYGGSLTTANYLENACESMKMTYEVVDNSVANELFQNILAVSDKSHSNIIGEKLIEIMSDLIFEKAMTFKPHLAIFIAQSPVSKKLIQ
ncbi:MAG: hypothetical protein PHR06_03030, partial [Candidatus Cloacimonetes bacterium]|nr:hypothetical protein [Candidatus Cloacimonadota bacterium]